MIDTELARRSTRDRIVEYDGRGGKGMVLVLRRLSDASDYGSGHEGTGAGENLSSVHRHGSHSAIVDFPSKIRAWGERTARMALREPGNARYWKSLPRSGLRRAMCAVTSVTLRTRLFPSRRCGEHHDLSWKRKVVKPMVANASLALAFGSSALRWNICDANGVSNEL